MAAAYPMKTNVSNLLTSAVLIDSKIISTPIETNTHLSPMMAHCWMILHNMVV